MFNIIICLFRVAIVSSISASKATSQAASLPLLCAEAPTRERFFTITAFENRHVSTLPALSLANIIVPFISKHLVHQHAMTKAAHSCFRARTLQTESTSPHIYITLGNLIFAFPDATSTAPKRHASINFLLHASLAPAVGMRLHQAQKNLTLL